MKQTLRYLFIALYGAGVCWLLLGTAELLGLVTGSLLRLVIVTMYLVTCFTAYLWLTPFYLSTKRLRKTILEEEEWLHPLMHELNLRTCIHPLPEILILEEPEIDGYAIGISSIVLSRGLLVKLNEQEVKAVLAHEYGHLRDRDTIAASAYEVAAFPTLYLYQLLKGGFKKRSLLKHRPRYMLFVIAMIVVSCYHFEGLFYFVVIVFIFIMFYPMHNALLTILWTTFSRASEFRQDAFAQSLGCGKHLKSALLKIDAVNSEALVNRLAALRSTHPLLYARIRRLESLEGLRSTP